MEVGHVVGGKPRRDGGSHAGPDRDRSGRSARHWSVHPTGRIHCILVSQQPLGLGVGHLMDMGTAGSGTRVARTGNWKRRPQMGRGLLAGATVAIGAVVVDLS